MGTGRMTPRRSPRVQPGRIIRVATIAALAVVLAHAAPSRIAAGASRPAQVGSPAPDFTLQLFNGQSVTLSSLRGKPVVVNFWHSG